MRVKDSPQLVAWYADAMSTPGGFSVAVPPPALTVDQLRRLLHKYELLLCLSRGEPGRTEPRRDAMRAIAELFPAALREWEELPPAELARRHQQVTEQLAESERLGAHRSAAAEMADWLRYGLDLHDCLRAVLQLRRYLSQQAGGRLPRGPRAASGDGLPADRTPIPTTAHLTDCHELVRGCEVPWLTVTPELLRAIAAPASGRLTALAYDAVAARHGTTAARIKLAIFGPRGGCGGRPHGGRPLSPVPRKWVSTIVVTDLQVGVLSSAGGENYGTPRLIWASYWRYAAML